MSYNIKRHLTLATGLLLFLPAGWFVAAGVYTHNVGAKAAVIKVEPKQPQISGTDQKPQLSFVNKIRAAHHLAPLSEDRRLDASAKLKGDDIVAKQYWAHTAPTGQSFYVSIYQQIPALHHSGENLGKCFNDEPALFDAFVKSPEHLKNIVDPGFSIFGSAMEWDNTRHCMIYVNHFGGY